MKKRTIYKLEKELLQHRMYLVNVNLSSNTLVEEGMKLAVMYEIVKAMKHLALEYVIPEMFWDYIYQQNSSLMYLFHLVETTGFSFTDSLADALIDEINHSMEVIACV